MEQQNAIISQLLTQWNKDVAAMTGIFETQGEGNAFKEVASGRNSVVYLLGHMLAVHDRLVEALDAGERQFTQLDKTFLEDADAKRDYPPYDALLAGWKKTSETVAAIFAKQDIAGWLSRHHYVSEADFQKEPHRNRLAILISRLAHLNTHLGQLKLLK
jgi:hypothetical protein